MLGDSEWLLYDLSHIVVVWGLRFILRSEAWEDTLLQIDDVPTIMLSNQKWAFLNHGAIHCLPRHEKNGSRTDVYCVNDMTSRSARYIALHDKQFTLGTESVTGLHYSIWILSDRGECASMRIKVVDLSRHVSDIYILLLLCHHLFLVSLSIVLTNTRNYLVLYVYTAS